jgi:hypothetical protein
MSYKARTNPLTRNIYNVIHNDTRRKMEVKDELGLLRKLKKRSGWSYDRISKEIGIHHQTVQGWFTGKNNPGQLSRKAIREFLKKKKGG